MVNGRNLHHRSSFFLKFERREYNQHFSENRNESRQLLSTKYNQLVITQAAFTYSKSTIETREQRCEICSKLTIKPPKRRQWRRFGGFIVNVGHISHLCSRVSIINFEHVIAGWAPTHHFISNVKPLVFWRFQGYRNGTLGYIGLTLFTPMCWGYRTLKRVNMLHHEI